MKLLLSAVCSVLFVTSALAQRGEVVVNVGGAVNCVSTKGESGFDATSYSLGGTEATSKVGSSSGAGAGKLDLSDLTINKNFDACSEQLIRTFLAGKVIPTLTLIQYSAGEHPFAALTITLSTAIINDYQVTGAPDVRPTESLAFTYNKVCVKSVSQKPDGSLESPVTVCYDVARGMLS
jgi:type VI secretion system secreted protein Hcp